MSVAVITDCHLGGPGGEAEPLIEQLRALPEQGCRRVILLGDIFHVWIGARRFETPEVAAVVPELRRLREMGLRVEYVEGNRDFFLQGSPYAEAFDRIAFEIPFSVGGVRYLAVHGDGLNDRDLQYRFWRWLSKSWLSRGLVTRIPRRLAQRTIDSTEARLAKTNFKHKAQVPEAVIRRYAQERLTEGHDVLLLGHFHEPRHWQVEGGEVRLLDAWFRSQRVEWFR